MYYANDNANENLVSFSGKTMESILATPTSLLAEDLYNDLYNILMDEGYNVENMEMCRDLAVIGEMIRAMLDRHDGEHHDYQHFLDQVQIAHEPTE